MKTWNIQHTVYKVSDFISWQRNKELDLRPYFQRRPLWPAGAKSYFVDTIMRGLPIPAILLRETSPDLETYKSKRQVVDGQQRIRTVISFIAPEALPDHDPSKDDFAISRAHNPLLAGARFRDLAREIRTRILDYQFSVHIFPTETDDRDILEIFARMNATGYKLNNQELRNAKFFGEFKTASFDLAAEQLHRWRDWHLFTDQLIARMAEVEFTSELMILMMKGISEGSKRVIDDVYRKNEDKFAHANEVSKRFRTVMDAIEDKFDATSRAPFEKKTLFYPFFAAVYDMHYGLESPLSSAKLKTASKHGCDALVQQGTKIAQGTAPQEILQITQRRVTQAGVRRKLANYLRG